MGKVIDMAAARLKREAKKRAKRIKEGLEEWAKLCKSYDEKDKDDE